MFCGETPVPPGRPSLLLHPIMPDTLDHFSKIEHPEEHLNSTLELLRTLHEKQFPSEPAAYRGEKKWSLLHYKTAKTTRRAIRDVFRSVQRHGEAQGWTEDRVQFFQNAFAERIYESAWQDATLSSEDNAIADQKYGRVLVLQELERIVREKPHVEELQKTGWLMFDVNGLKSLIDCTSSQNGGNFLRRLAAMLQKRGVTRTWLEQEHKTSVRSFTAGGDEYTMLLQSRDPISSEVLKEASMNYQKEVGDTRDLHVFLNLDDRRVLEWFLSHEEKQLYDALSEEEKTEKRAAIRQNLPDRFMSVSAGSARLDEAIILSGVRWKRTGNPQSFSAAGKEIFRDLFSIAEKRQKENKVQMKSDLRNVNRYLHTWYLRTREARNIAATRREAEEIMQKVQSIHDASDMSDAEKLTAIQETLRTYRLFPTLFGNGNGNGGE